MITIEPVLLGLPAKSGVKIMIRPIINSTTDTSCKTYYQIFPEEGGALLEGEFPISEEDYALWSDDNAFIENIVLKRLGLRRKAQAGTTNA